MKNKASRGAAVLCVVYVIMTLFTGSNVYDHYGIFVNERGILAFLNVFGLPFLLVAFIMSFPRVHFQRIEIGLVIASCLIAVIQYFFLTGMASIGILITTVFEPLMLYALLRILPQRYFKIIRRVILVFLFVECGIAFYEFFSHTYVFRDMFAQSIDFQTGMTDMRAASLHGHPLQNAFMVAIVITVIVASRMDNKKYLLFLMGLVAILCFNTRSSIVLMGVILIINLFRDFYTGKKSWSRILLVTLLVGVVVYYGIDLAQEYGLGSRMDMGFGKEEGSSRARYDLIAMMMYDMKWDDWLFGVKVRFIESMFAKYGLICIENSILQFVFKYGVIYTVFFYVTWVLIINRFKASRFMRYTLLFVVFVLINTNNALVVRTPLVATTVMCLFCFRDELLLKPNKRK